MIGFSKTGGLSVPGRQRDGRTDDASRLGIAWKCIPQPKNSNGSEHADGLQTAGFGGQVILTIWRAFRCCRAPSGFNSSLVLGQH